MFQCAVRPNGKMPVAIATDEDKGTRRLSLP